MATATQTVAASELLALASLLEYPTPALAQATGVGLEQLENAHVRLFGNDQGGISAPPFAGCYLDGDRLEFLVHIGGLCRQLGVALQPSHPPDYIPLMLEVLALLGNAGLAAEDLRSCYRLWPDRFAEALRQHDDTGVYAAVAADLAAALATI